MIRQEEAQVSEQVDDDMIILFDEDDVINGVEKCERSVIARIVTKKLINKISFQNAMTNNMR